MQLFHLAELKKNMITLSLPHLNCLYYYFFRLYFHTHTLDATHLGIISSVKIITKFCEKKKNVRIWKKIRDTDCIALQQKNDTFTDAHSK